MRLIIAACILLGAFVPAFAEDGVSRGALLSYSCAACHGTDGVSQGSIPALKGLPRAYIASQLLAFRGGGRDSTVMGRIAKGYTEQDIRDIAAHFGKLNQETRQ